MKIKKECCTTYNQEKDRFELWIITHENKWGFSYGWDCQECHGKKEFIHFSIINKLNECIDFGYEYIGFMPLDNLW